MTNRRTNRSLTLARYKNGRQVGLPSDHTARDVDEGVSTDGSAQPMYGKSIDEGAVVTLLGEDNYERQTVKVDYMGTEFVTGAWCLWERKPIEDISSDWHPPGQAGRSQRWTITEDGSSFTPVLIDDSGASIGAYPDQASLDAAKAFAQRQVQDHPLTWSDSSQSALLSQSAV